MILAVRYMFGCLMTLRGCILSELLWEWSELIFETVAELSVIIRIDDGCPANMAPKAACISAVVDELPSGAGLN